MTPSRFALQECLYPALAEGKKQLLAGIREVQDGNADIVFSFQFRIAVDFHRCPSDPHVPQHIGDLIAQVTADQGVKYQFLVVWIVHRPVDSNALLQRYFARPSDKFRILRTIMSKLSQS